MTEPSDGMRSVNSYFLPWYILGLALFLVVHGAMVYLYRLIDKIQDMVVDND